MTYPYRPSQPVVRPVQNWTAPSSYRPNPYKWVNPNLRSGSDQYKADLQPVRSDPRPGLCYSTTYRGRPADRVSPIEPHRCQAPACLQRAERSCERSSESLSYTERSQSSRSRDHSPPPKRFRGEFIVLDEYSSESDTSLATSSVSGSSLASSSETGSNTSRSEISSSSSTVLYSTGSGSSLASSSETESNTLLSGISSSSSTVLYRTGSESSLDVRSDCSVGKPEVEAGGHEPKETPELWGTYMSDEMERQLESWASEKHEDFVSVTPKLRENSNKGQSPLTKSVSATKLVLQSSVVAKQEVTCPPKPCIQSSVVARSVVMPTQPALQSAVGAWTTPVQRFSPGPSPAVVWGPRPYPQSSVRCEVAWKRPLEEYDNEAAPSAKIDINKNHPRFRHLFQ